MLKASTSLGITQPPSHHPFTPLTFFFGEQYVVV
jgi:hypothetical protein